MPERRFTPFTAAYLAVLVATSAVLASISTARADRLLLSRSTNLHHLAHDPLGVLLASALWLAGPWQLPLAAAAFALVLYPVERRIGSLRTAAAFAAGHVGATLLVAGGLVVALELDAVDRHVVDARDVGVSYGVTAVAGLLTYLLDPRLRVLYALGVSGFLVAALAASPGFTGFGHLLAFLIGLGCYRLARPAGTHPGPIPSRLPARAALTGRMARLLALGALVATAVVAAGFAFAGGSAASTDAGIVVVETNLAFENGAGAATGMVLTPTGEVLTNNHVIRGATTIRVVLPASGRRYRARVLGYSVAGDVALLRLAGASGLRTVSLGDSSKLRVGQRVTAVGNAGGTGTLTRAPGTVVGLGRSITASDDEGGVERLTGLIETNAAVRPGDSGGPLLDGADRVVGMDTAASAGFVFQSGGGNAGFAIPIARALALAKQIEAGRASATVHIGPTALLGVRVRTAGDLGPSGALVIDVVPGSPADAAGLQPDDVITAVDGRAIASAPALTSRLLRHAPGDTVRITWADAFGRRSASVRLANGPPQ